MSDENVSRNQTLQRQALLAQRFVALADTLVEDFDIVELLDGLMKTSLELLDVDEAGLLLLDKTNRLQLVASSSESARMLELLQLNERSGPCVDVVHSGRPVVVDDLHEGRISASWPRFTRNAIAHELSSVYAFPLRLRHEVIGGLNLFGRRTHLLDADARVVAQSLADIATIGIMHQRAIERSTYIAESLQTALNTRIVIEQAKGALAERGKVPMDVAFELLRRYARAHQRRLGDVARDVVHPPNIGDEVLGFRPV